MHSLSMKTLYRDHKSRTNRKRDKAIFQIRQFTKWNKQSKSQWKRYKTQNKTNPYATSTEFLRWIWNEMSCSAVHSMTANETFATNQRGKQSRLSYRSSQYIVFSKHTLRKNSQWYQLSLPTPPLSFCSPLVSSSHIQKHYQQNSNDQGSKKFRPLGKTRQQKPFDSRHNTYKSKPDREIKSERALIHNTETCQCV